MSTGLVENWTGTISEIGPLYPFVGTEVFWWIVGVALWILWHVWQARHESQEYADDLRNFDNEKSYKKALGGE